MADERKPFWGKCAGCGHCWPIAYLPMEVAAVAKLMAAARCPACASKTLVIAKQGGGVLQEPNAAEFTSIASHGGTDVAGP